MKVDEKLIEHVDELDRVKLKKEEIKEYTQQIKEVLDSYSKLDADLKPFKIMFDLYFLKRSVVNELKEITIIFFLFSFKSLNNACLTISILSSEAKR